MRIMDGHLAFCLGGKKLASPSLSSYGKNVGLSVKVSMNEAQLPASFASTDGEASRKSDVTSALSLSLSLSLSHSSRTTRHFIPWPVMDLRTPEPEKRIREERGWQFIALPL